MKCALLVSCIYLLVKVSLKEFMEHLLVMMKYTELSTAGNRNLNQII